MVSDTVTAVATLLFAVGITAATLWVDLWIQDREKRKLDAVLRKSDRESGGP